MKSTQYNLFMHHLVIIGGIAPKFVPFDRSAYSSVVAADSGYDTAKLLSIPVDSVVGDLDSTSFRDEIESLGFKACSHDKDESDAELAIRSIEGTYDLIGGGEGRLDHTLALLSSFSRLGCPETWFLRVDTIVTLKGRVQISLPVGTELSFFAPFGRAEVKSEGLVWNLDNFPFDGSVSLSNRAGSELIRLEVKGTVMMRMRPEDYSVIKIRRDVCLE